MQNKLFSIGQEVTPNVKNWDLMSGQQLGDIPKYGEIYKVSDYEWDDSTGAWLLTLQELHPADWFEQEGFSPVLPQEDLEELMQEETWKANHYY